MDTYEKILVVVLASALAVLLGLGIFILVKLIKIINRLNRISEKVEMLAFKAASLGDVLGKISGPLALGKFFAGKYKGSKVTKKGKK